MSIVDPFHPASTSAPSSRAERANLAELHESVAGLLAARGDYRGAYEHLRSACSLLRDLPDDTAGEPAELRHEVTRLRREHAQAREQSLRDSLTDSYNRRYLDERLLELVQHTAETGRAISVAIADLDLFKLVNDSHGHHIGDRVLQVVVDLLQQDLSAESFCARYGGEEFVLVLPDVNFGTAVALVEKARARIEKHDWSTIADGLRVTTSVGISHGTPADTEEFQAELIRADQLLYAAKQSGRNAVAYPEGGLIRLAGPARGRRVVIQQPLTPEIGRRIT